jgi:transcriptional regulator with XRE-family HTH domain
MDTTQQLLQLNLRLRLLRESRNLTLVQAAALSQDSITAMALGSYERGDRAITAAKLVVISQMYGVPLQALFAAPDKTISSNRITVDIRKVNRNGSELSKRFSGVVAKIARMRSDWNGELISLRSEDLKNLSTFSGFSPEDISLITREYVIPRSK